MTEPAAERQTRVHPDTLVQIRSRVQRAQMMGDVAESLSIPEQMWLSRYAEDVPFLLDAYDLQQAELGWAREAPEGIAGSLEAIEAQQKLGAPRDAIPVPLKCIANVLARQARAALASGRGGGE